MDDIVAEKPTMAVPITNGATKSLSDTKTVIYPTSPAAVLRK
jgi:hypothetical protein